MYILDARRSPVADLGKGKGCPWGDEVQYVIVAPDRRRISYRVSLFGLQAGAEWTWCVELRPDSYGWPFDALCSYVQSYYSSTTTTTMTRLVSDITSVVLHQSVVITS